jgi:hypothetical protein
MTHLATGAHSRVLMGQRGVGWGGVDTDSILENILQDNAEKADLTVVNIMTELMLDCGRWENAMKWIGVSANVRGVRTTVQWWMVEVEMATADVLICRLCTSTCSQLVSLCPPQPHFHARTKPALFTVALQRGRRSSTAGWMGYPRTCP